MADTLVRRALFPPRAQRMPSAERVRLIAWARILATLSAAIGNVSVFAILSQGGGVRGDMVTLGTGVNGSLLLADVVLTLLFLRRKSRLYVPVFRLCILMEVIAGTLWLQLTGSVSSYYIGAGLLLIVMYRLGTDYQAGLWFAVGTFVGHYAIFVFEELGMLQPASLFFDQPGGIYASSTFRWAAMFSMSWMYGVAFLAGNFVASLLTEKDRAVDAAQQDLKRVVEEARHGRLSGATLAGKYALADVLGRGGMGEVYAAHRVADGTPIAVKVLHAHMSQSREARERFRREAQVAARLSSAHVPMLHDFGTTSEGHDFIVMDLLVGEDLAAVLRRRGSLDPAELADILTGVAGALDAAHAAGVVHRDLKPQNIVLVGGRANDVRLLDFGVACLLERGTDADTRLTETEAIVGTAGYLAPEQARASMGPIGPHTDVFALAIVVYRALTGKAAFPSRTPAAAIDEAINLYPPAPSKLVPGVHADVDAVLALGMAKKVAHRYQSANEFAGDFRAALRGELGDTTRARAGRLPRPAAAEGVFEPTIEISGKAVDG